MPTTIIFTNLENMIDAKMEIQNNLFYKIHLDPLRYMQDYSLQDKMSPLIKISVI